MKEENVIEVRNLTKKFGNFTAVDNIGFDVKRGEIFGFLGANGAGKSTAMRILCGLIKPTSGSAYIAGNNVITHPETVKKQIGYMSQKFSLYNNLRVWENLKLYGGIYGMNGRSIESKTKELLTKLEFDEHKNSLVGDLPTGWKQKLAFMAAIIHTPRIVFLDEPTGGVDPKNRRQFWDLIYDAAQQNITVFVTTHYMDEAEYCDRVSIMTEGRIEALDTPKKLKEKYNLPTMDAVFTTIARGE